MTDTRKLAVATAFIKCGAKDESVDGDGGPTRLVFTFEQLEEFARLVQDKTIVECAEAMRALSAGGE